MSGSELDRNSLEGSRLLPTYSHSNQRSGTYLGQNRTKMKHRKQDGSKINRKKDERKYFKLKDSRYPDLEVQNSQNSGIMVNSFKIGKSERTHSLENQS